MRNFMKTATFCLALTLAFSTAAIAFPGAEKSAQPATAPERTAVQGTVVNTMDSGGYTYLQVENDGQKTWAAIPDSKVEVGQEVQLSPGMTMKQFTSKTLNRTFENILFSQGIVSAN